MSKKTETPKKEAPKKVEEKAKEAPKEEAKPETPEKAAKSQKKRKQEKKISTLYKIESDKISRLRPICERCGTGYFMADHGNRYTCGHCGLTRYKHAESGQA